MSETSMKELDVRVIEFNLRRGTLPLDQYKKYLESLPDSAEEAIETQVTFEPIVASRAEGSANDES
ncbi:MAG: hypothetical protein EA397_03780 [Deltaproteobacteria bacterium]|nr:MAG: hypothetical protein EA397_03780 [Deltaproteobacteria bacterium]